MIENDAQLCQSVEQLQRLLVAMAVFYHEIYPVNPRQFQLFAEGPNDQIEELMAQINRYTGRDKMFEVLSNDVDGEDRENSDGQECPSYK